MSALPSSSVLKELAGAWPVEGAQDRVISWKMPPQSLFSSCLEPQVGLGHVVECLCQQETPKDEALTMHALWYSRLPERTKEGLVGVGMGLRALEGGCPGVRLRFSYAMTAWISAW